jgi:ABC-type transport system involved in cytochrome bd biosynthesis fused ATPase/permease subunit
VSNCLTCINIDFAQAAQAANRILSFRVSQKHDTKATSDLQDTEGGVKIELRDLWFKYPTRDVPIFTGLNLTVRNLSTVKIPNVDFNARLKRDNSQPWLDHLVVARRA